MFWYESYWSGREAGDARWILMIECVKDQEWVGMRLKCTSIFDILGERLYFFTQLPDRKTTKKKKDTPQFWAVLLLMRALATYGRTTWKPTTKNMMRQQEQHQQEGNMLQHIHLSRARRRTGGKIKSPAHFSHFLLKVIFIGDNIIRLLLFELFTTTVVATTSIKYHQ